MEAAALTGAQRAGLACVLCGADLTGAPIPSRPVGKVREGQVFACTSHDEEPGDEPAGDMDVPGWYAPPVPVRQDDGMSHVENRSLDERLLRVANRAADMWAIESLGSSMTAADRTRGIVETAVMHLIEQGLLVMPEDLSDRLDKPIKARRERP